MGERPHRFTGVVGAAPFSVGVLIIFLSATLSCASRHLGFYTFGKRIWPCDDIL